MRRRTHKKNFWFNDEEENRIKELCNKSGMNEREYREELIRLDILIDDLKLQFLNKSIAGWCLYIYTNTTCFIRINHMEVWIVEPSLEISTKKILT